MLQHRSLSTRFVVTAVGVTAVTFVVFVSLLLVKLDANLERQTTELERIEDGRLGRQLDSDVALTDARLKFQNEDIARRILGVSARADTVAAINSRNNVAIEHVLKTASRFAGADTIVATDDEVNVIGASIGDADIVALNELLRSSGLRDRIATSLSKAERSDPVPLTIVAADEGAPSLGASGGPVSLIVAVPVFDDFGDVLGSLVAQRFLREREPILQAFAAITGSAVAVFHGGELVTRANIGPDIRFKTEGRRLTARAEDRTFIARCGESLDVLKLCAFKPLEDLFAAQNELTVIGQIEGNRLVRWLVVIGVASAVGTCAAVVLTAMTITRPLRRLSEVVSRVTGGDYSMTVEDTDRRDEIGEIARAIRDMRDDAAERSRLKASLMAKNMELERHKRELLKQNVLFDAALNNMPHGLCMFDENRSLIVSNARYSEMFAIGPELLARQPSFDELAASQGGVGRGGTEGPPCIFGGRPGHERSSVESRLADGRTILTTRQPLDGGGWVAIYEDISEREKARELLVHQARHDSLTQLPNRIELKDQLADRLKQMATDPASSFTVLYIDLDEFKEVNDTLGHPAGDRLLQEVARRIVRQAGPDHHVARLGGDEFAVVTPVCKTTDTECLPKALIEVICKPYRVYEQDIVIGASIGVAVAPLDGTDPDDLLKHADLALYRAKSEGKNTFRRFLQEMAASALERQQLVQDLRCAIEDRGLSVHLQPICRLSDGSVVGFEALARWDHPKLGAIAPATFVPIAEETGLIVTMGEWIVREACSQAASWPAPLRIAVNVSARQLKEGDFVTTVADALATNNLASSRLELEITESVLLQDDEETRATLLHLKSLGVSIAMDDFGTGYSSLSCLHSFPFDKIKIDQSFVRTMNESGNAASIVAAVINLGRSLKMTTTAEGIEGPRSLAILREMGCPEGQGFYLGRPKPASEVTHLLEAPTLRSYDRTMANS